MKHVHELENEAIHLKVKVETHSWAGFLASDDNYEPGFPLGSGKTIRDALDNYLDAAHAFYIERWNHSTLTYTWS